MLIESTVTQSFESSVTRSKGTCHATGGSCTSQHRRAALTMMKLCAYYCYVYTLDLDNCDSIVTVLVICPTFGAL